MAMEWQRVESILDQVLDAPASERGALLDSLCGGEAELRREVESLLASMAGSTGVLDRELAVAAGGLAAELDEELAPGAAGAGKRVGPWELIEPLGSGGMGRVYRARRADGAFEREVAVKILRWELDDPVLRDRFSNERQILAQLNHPGIARLLDGGVTEEGLPYLVMESVEGRPIDQYCREEGLDVEARLSLFSKVAETMSEAHRSLVAHRDLKPSNILVEEGGMPRLLDFGIGKVLGEGDDLTRTGQGPYTARYASPEQLAGKPAGTASDVYSLGVLLYELLAGEAPFPDAEERSGEGDPRLRGEIPRAVSERMRRSSDSEVARSAKWVAGDLDAVIAKALAPAPADRYGWAGDLADDLERFRSGLPVTARGVTRFRRAVLFVRRNKAAVAGGVALALTLAGAAFFSMRQAAVAQTEREQAEEAASFALDLLRLPDPDTSGGTTLSALEILEEGAQRAESVQDPEVRRRLFAVIGQGLANLEEWDRATELHLTAARLAGRPEVRSREVADALYAAGRVQSEKGDVDAGVPLLLEAEEIYRGLDGDRSEDVAGALFQRASLMARNTADTDPRRVEAMGLLAEARAIYRELEPAGSLDLAQVIHLEGMQLFAFHFSRVPYGEGDLSAQSLERLETAIAMRREIAGPDSTVVGIALNDQATVLAQLEQQDRAIAALLEARKIFQDAGWEDHPEYKNISSNLARSYQMLGRYDEAVQINREVIERFPDFAYAHFGLALALLGKRDLGAAEVEFETTIELLPDGAPEICIAESFLGETLYRQERLAEAEALLRRALASCEVMQGAGSPTSKRIARVLEAVEKARRG